MFILYQVTVVILKSLFFVQVELHGIEGLSFPTPTADTVGIGNVYMSFRGAHCFA